MAFLKVETDVGIGEGLVRLATEDGTWKAYILFTVLKELKGHAEPVGEKRPLGPSRYESSQQRNWQEERAAEEKF
jgi:hypothetical protein